MRVLIKHMLKNIVEKKFRTLIVIISIMISSALFFASNEISDSMVKISTDRLRQYVGTSDIVIRPNDKSPSPYFETAGADPFKGETEYINGALEGVAQYVKDNASSNIRLLGMANDDMQQMNPVTLQPTADWASFNGQKVVISERTATKFGFKQGDTLTLQVGGKDSTFSVFGIANPVGLFREDGGNMFALLPKSTLNDILEADGDVNAIFIKVKAGTNVSDLIDKLSKPYTDYLVSESISAEEIKSQVGAVADTFMLMTIIVSLLSIFIINSSIKVIVFERLPIIGTFRSVGSTKRMTNALMLGESALYGVFGGLFGCLLGIGILHLMTSVLSDGGAGDAGIDIKPYRLAFTMLMAIILPLISSMLPIMRAAKTPLKDIILNKIDDDASSKAGRLRLVLGVLFLAAAWFVPPQMPRDLALPIGIICAVLIMIGITLITPSLLRLYSRVLEKAAGGVLGNEGMLACKNIRDNKNVVTNITLLSIAIATLLMINIVGYGVVEELTNFYSTTPQYDVLAQAKKMDADFVRKTEQLDGVKSVYASYQSSDVEVEGKQGQIGLLEGANNSFTDYWNYTTAGGSQAMFDKLQEGRNIVLSIMLKNKFGVELGDTLTLKMKKGDQTYKVTGFLNTSRNSANYAVILEDNLKADMGNEYYGSLYIKTKQGADPEQVVKTFQKEFIKHQPDVQTRAHIAEIDNKNSEQQFTILKGFSLLSLLISVLAVVNNLVINFIQRKRALAMYRSVGMSKAQIIKMVMIESAAGGILGSLAGILGGVTLIAVVPYILSAIDQRVVIHYSLQVFLYTFAAGVLVTVFASLVPALKSSKLHIIESIKMD